MGYMWTEEHGIRSEEDNILQKTWESGAIGLFDEDFTDGNGGTNHTGSTISKVKNHTSSLVKVQFGMVPRGPSNIGNVENDLASRQSSTSTLTPQQKKGGRTGVLGRQLAP